MKIIGGEFKRLAIEMPKDIRPTSNKVREALFEVLKGSIEGANFLDLYCGSGAVGMEALSRGAGKVVFVDNDIKCISVLKKNLGRLDHLATRVGCPPSAEQPTRVPLVDIYNKDAIKALGVFEKEGMVFDVIFLDPPYYKDIAKNTLIEISNHDILSANVVIIAEIYKKESLPEEIGVLKKIRTYKYGDTVLELFKR